MESMLFFSIYGLFSFALLWRVWASLRENEEFKVSDCLLLLVGIFFVLIMAGVALYLFLMIGTGHKIRK